MIHTRTGVILTACWSAPLPFKNKFPGARLPRWTPENRPVVDTSKPASWPHPEQLGFTLRVLGPASFSSAEVFSPRVARFILTSPGG